MGFARTYSVALVGLRGHIVDVEADISQAARLRSAGSARYRPQRV